MNKMIVAIAALLLLAGIIAVSSVNFSSISGKTAGECSGECTKQASCGQTGCGIEAGSCGCQKAALTTCPCGCNGTCDGNCNAEGCNCPKA